MRNKTELWTKWREEIRTHIVKHELDQRVLMSRTVTFLHELSRCLLSVYLQNQLTKNEFKEDLVKQTVQNLFCKCVSQIESVLILIDNGKYPEAYSLLRNLFENAVFLFYVIEYPFEADRWLNWVNMNFNARQKYRKMEFEEFKSFLKRNGHDKLLNLIDSKNFGKYMDFSVGFIRNKAFENHQSIDGSAFNEFYSELCTYVHPSIKTMNFIDKLDDKLFRDIVVDSLFIARRVAQVYIDFFSDKISEEIIEEYENLKIEMKKNEDDFSQLYPKKN